MAECTKQERPILAERYLVFDLPFIINVSDSLEDAELRKWLSRHSAGEKDLPFNAYVPRPDDPGGFAGVGHLVFMPNTDDLVPPYRINVDGAIVQLFLLRRVNPYQFGLTRIGMEVPGDIAGRRSYSTIAVNFDMSDFKPETYNNSQLWADLALDAVNFFINCYRYIFDKPYIRCIDKSSIQRFTFHDVFDDESDSMMEFGTANGPAIGFLRTFGEDKDQELRSMLATGIGPKLFQLFRLEAMNTLAMGETHLSVILSEMLFESWVFAYLSDKYLAQGLDSGAIDSRYRKQKDPNSYKSITSIIKENIKEVTCQDFAQTKEFQDWATNTRDKRNEIIHRGLYRIPEEAAREAFMSAIRAIQYIAKM